jgi:predicted secreted protein
VAQTSDGGYIVAGGGYADGGTVCLLRTDASGDTVWTRAWGGVTYDVGRSVAMTADGGYVIAGSMDLFSIGGPDVWLIRTDSAGDTLWTRTFGGADNDLGRSVAQTADGGYIVAGYTESFGAGGYDVWLIKTDSAGNCAAVAEPRATTMSGI